MNERLPYLQKKASQLPQQPGVYIMKNQKGKIIYIGKAKKLINRVSQYFRTGAHHPIKVAQMVEHVYDFDYIVTDSEFEALVLECSFIKQHTPKYNILLKDDKGYHYIYVEAGDYPRISAQHSKAVGEGEYIGPYTSSYAVKGAVEETNRCFRLPTCKRKFPRDFRKERPCLNYYIGQCMGVCRGRISKEEYHEIMEQALSFLTGSKTSLLKSLNEQMAEAAERLDFERAAVLRDRIASIKRTWENQKVILDGEMDVDFIASVVDEDTICFVVLQFRAGKLTDKSDYQFELFDDKKTMTEQFVKQYYAEGAPVPQRVCLDESIEDMELIQRFLDEKRGKKVQIMVPQIGENAKLIEMAKSNAAQLLSQYTNKTYKEIAVLDELANLLGLSKPPRYIEAYDISNLGDSSIVAGMVVFKDGRPFKKAYKRFSLKDVVTQDDYSAMREVLSRRFKHYAEQDGDEGFSTLPDLLLIDGALGHVHAVLPVLEHYGLNIPVFGMAKDSKHKTRAIAATGGEISISASRRVFTLISTIQEEVHRFAIGYQRVKHGKKAFSSSLCQVPGISEKRASALLKQFKTIKAMREADVEMLRGVQGMNLPAAQRLYDFLHQDVDKEAQ